MGLFPAARGGITPNSLAWCFGTCIPSGEHTKSHGKSPFLMGKSTINGHFQLLCVGSPEGTWSGLIPAFPEQPASNLPRRVFYAQSLSWPKAESTSLNEELLNIGPKDCGYSCPRMSNSKCIWAFGDHPTHFSTISASFLVGIPTLESSNILGATLYLPLSSSFARPGHRDMFLSRWSAGRGVEAS